MVIGHPCPPCPAPKGDFVQRRSHIYGTGDHPCSSLLGGPRWTLGSRNFLFYAKDLASLIFKKNKIMVNLEAPKIKSNWNEKRDELQFSIVQIKEHSTTV